MYTVGIGPIMTTVYRIPKDVLGTSRIVPQDATGFDVAFVEEGGNAQIVFSTQEGSAVFANEGMVRYCEREGAVYQSSHQSIGSAVFTDAVNTCRRYVHGRKG